MRMHDKRCLAKERRPVGEGRDKLPNLRAKGYSTHLRGERHASRSHVVDVREVRVCGVSPNITKGTANAVPFVMLVETTSHSPEGESVLQEGEEFFLGKASASRRTCAHGAYDTPYMCGNGNKNTPRIYDGIAR